MEEEVQSRIDIFGHPPDLVLKNRTREIKKKSGVQRTSQFGLLGDSSKRYAGFLNSVELLFAKNKYILAEIFSGPLIV